MLKLVVENSTTNIEIQTNNKENKMSIDEDVKKIERECVGGSLNPQTAINQINEAIGGITGVIFKEGKKFKIINHNKMMSMSYNTSKKGMKFVYALACLAYQKAKENGSNFPGEVHISKQASTKHHMDGIYQILSNYA